MAAADVVAEAGAEVGGAEAGGAGAGRPDAEGEQVQTRE